MMSELKRLIFFYPYCYVLNIHFYIPIYFCIQYIIFTFKIVLVKRKRKDNYVFSQFSNI